MFQFRRDFKTLHSQSLTLVELMIISVIVAILLTMFSQNVLGINDESKVVVANQNLRSIEGAINLFQKDMQRYPTQEEGLQALLEGDKETNWQGPYLEAELLKDPWGNSYLYEINDIHFFLFTRGEDGIQGGSDLAQDIVIARPRR